MRDALFLLGVENLYGYLRDCDTSPCGANENFDFKLILPREKKHSAQCANGIQAITALRVAHTVTCFHPKPEIRKTIAEAALSGYAGLLHISRADNDSPAVVFE